MAASREELVQWALARAEENLASGAENLKAGRLHAAAENIFRTVETSLEALLYCHGVRRVEYPGRRKKFVGRLALQFLVRDTLVAQGRLSKDVSDKYLELAAELHGAGYEFGVPFEEARLQEELDFAEDFVDKVRATAARLST